MNKHVHKWSLDHQVIFTDDGEPQPRGECFAYCGCGEELRWHEITEILNEHDALNAKLEVMGVFIFNHDLSDEYYEEYDALLAAQQEQEQEDEQ